MSAVNNNKVKLSVTQSSSKKYLTNLSFTLLTDKTVALESHIIIISHDLQTPTVI